MGVVFMMFQMTKRWLAAWMSVLLMMSGVLVASPVGPVEVQAAPPSVNIGQYIQFGSYNSAPILWRVIYKDPTTGDPILFADRILTLKAFDSGGSYHSADHNLREMGVSNYYKDSNIRQWLNSSSANTGGNVIDWIQNDPSAANLYGGENPYNTEKGFLADGNFTSTERSLIKSYTHKVLLADLDVAKKDGGLASHTRDDNIATVVQNYDTAYYQNVTDNIFLLSVKQLKEWVYDNNAALGTNYYFAKPTAEAVTQSTIKSGDIDSTTNFKYWLNSPMASSQWDVLFVDVDGAIVIRPPFFPEFGVRPALQLDMSKTSFASGAGNYWKSICCKCSTDQPSADRHQFERKFAGRKCWCECSRRHA
jgi:hypothetical protein